MAKPTAPLLSFDARGQIAKTQVYASWRGRPYVRRYTIPANPRSSGQIETRSVFTWLQNVWKLLDSDAQAPWLAAAKGNAVTDRNLWTKANLPILRPLTALTGIVFSPGYGGMFPPTSVATAATLIAGQLNITFTPPPLPAGWTLDTVVAITIADQDPHNGTLYETTLSGSPTSPLLLTGLSSGTLYQIGVLAAGIKPDGTRVFSTSIAQSGTPL